LVSFHAYIEIHGQQNIKFVRVKTIKNYVEFTWENNFELKITNRGRERERERERE
jgi:hypothetical protein